MRLPSLGRPVVPLLLVLFLRVALANAADLIYDNSANGGTNVYYSAFEYGDEIVLAQGTSHVMGQFLFEYYGDFTPTGDEKAELRLYKNDGPPISAQDSSPTPGTVLYDTGLFSIAPGYQTKTITGLNITLPDDLTWTVQFTGLTAKDSDEAGLIFRDPPTVGTSYDDVWIKNNGTSWQLFNWGGNPMANFAARIVSIDTTKISISLVGKQVIVEWPGLSILQVATSVNGPYTDIATARNKYTANATKEPALFWRLRN